MSLNHTKRAFVMIWELWHNRNQIVFDNGIADVEAVIDRVKTVSWKWWIARSTGSPCLLYEWLSEPIVL
jgi:hypothetical protein